jgi:hypothetical protein
VSTDQSEQIHAVDGTLAFEVGPNGARPGVRVTTHLPLSGSTLSIPLDEDATQAMAMAMLSVAPDNARPAAPSAPATPAAGVRTPEGATGAPGGAGEVGLGDAIRANLVARPYRGPGLGLRALADRADELEAAYRVADAEIARLSEFHDHYRDQVARVRAQLARMTKSSVVETRRHGIALLHILDGDA